MTIGFHEMHEIGIYYLCVLSINTFFIAILLKQKGDFFAFIGKI